MAAETDTRVICILWCVCAACVQKIHLGHSENGAVGWIHLGHQCHLFPTRPQVPTDPGNALHYWLRHHLIPVRQGESVGTEDPDSWRLSRLVLSLWRAWCYTCTAHGNRTGIFLCSIWSETGDHYTISEARYHINTQKARKLLNIKSLPPTDKNLFMYILRTHLQTILAKSAVQQAPPELDITKYGWKINDGT